MGQVGQSFNLSWYFYAWGGKVKKEKINLVATFVSRFLDEENLPKFGQTVLSKHCKIPAGTGLCHLCPVQCPQLLQDGECWLSLASPENLTLLSRDLCLGCGSGAAGFAFGGTGVIAVKKMGMESLQKTEGLEAERTGVYQ